MPSISIKGNNPSSRPEVINIMVLEIRNLLIQTANELDDDQYRAVATQLYAMKGVYALDRNQQTPGIIQVAYGVGMVHAMNILNKFTRMGFNASVLSV